MSARATWVTWVGRGISGLLIAFLMLDGIMKLVQPEPVLRACAELGIPQRVIAGIGITLIVCTAVYAIPQTAVLGAILLTGYLGGAIMTHLRVVATGGHFPIFFSLAFGILVWVGVYLREPRLRALMPLRRGTVPTLPAPVLTAA